jgi:lauroyl/myristoyl acyltransferase
MSLWKRIRHHIEAASVRLFAWFIPRLSRERCVRLANALGEIACRLDRRGRAVALANVECALGDSLSAEQRREVVHASYRNFARTMVDLFWAPALAFPENRRWLRIHYLTGCGEHIAGKGVVLLTLHFGNWEWASLSAPWMGHAAIAVAEEFKNPALAGIFRSLRETTGQTIIPQENSMMKMLRTVKRGGCTALLTDLTLRPQQASTVIRAFGLELCVSMLHAVLAQRAGALIVPGMCLPDADGGATIHFLKPLKFNTDASLQQIAQTCWDHFEPHIRARPGLWLWPYKHFRYKPRGTMSPYPFYANESGAFEKLRRKELGA